MNIYTVTFFGHRHLSDPFAVEKQLEPILHDLITSKEYVYFFVGRDGEFDQLAASTVRKAIGDYACGNASLILVLPYERAEYRDNRESFEAYYDEIEICLESANAHPKAAIFERNNQMILQADLVICAIEHDSGGAFMAVKFAEKQLE